MGLKPITVISVGGEVEQAFQAKGTTRVDSFRRTQLTIFVNFLGMLQFVNTSQVTLNKRHLFPHIPGGHTSEIKMVVHTQFLKRL